MTDDANLLMSEGWAHGRDEVLFPKKMDLQQKQ
jgi:hypothetical protein